MITDKETSWNNTEEMRRAKQAVVFCGLILFVNILTLIISASSSRLRRRSKYHIIISICVLNICSCMAYFPLSVHNTLHQKSLDVKSISFLQTTAYFVHPSIVGLSITVLGIDHLLNKFNYVPDFGSTVLISVMGVVLPWLYGFVAYMPCLYQNIIIEEAFYRMSNYTSSQKFDKTEENNDPNISGMLNNNSSFWLSGKTSPTVSASSIAITIFFWGVLPIITLTAINICASFIRCVPHSESSMQTPVPIELWNELAIDQHQPQFNNRNDENKGCSFESLFSALVFVLCRAPLLYDLVRVLHCNSSDFCVISKPTDYTFTLISWAVSFLLPAVWILDFRFREAIFGGINRLCLKT